MEQPQRITNLEKFTALFLMKLFCPFINFNKLFIHFIFTSRATNKYITIIISQTFLCLSRV
jgi:hypothetical protein